MIFIDSSGIDFLYLLECVTLRKALRMQESMYANPSYHSHPVPPKKTPRSLRPLRFPPPLIHFTGKQRFPGEKKSDEERVKIVDQHIAFLIGKLAVGHGVTYMVD